MTSVIENLNILDVVTADRITAQLSLSQDTSGGQPMIAALGSRFENLRIAGSPVLVELDPPPIKRFSVGASPNSLIKKIQCDCPGVKIEGNVIRVPHLGDIRLAEMSWSSGSWQLTMLKMSLQSPTKAELSLASGGVGGRIANPPPSAGQGSKVKSSFGSGSARSHFMGCIPLKDIFHKILSERSIESAYMKCPRCGYSAPALVNDLYPGILSGWPSPADLNHHLHSLERLNVHTADELLDARPIELLRSGIPLQNLFAYVEAGRHWVFYESQEARALLARHGWSDKALGSISQGMALRLAMMLEGEQDDRMEVVVQMGDALSLEQVIDMNPRERLSFRQAHARRSQSELIGALELGDNYTQIWLSNQFIAVLNVNQIRRIAANPFVRGISPTLPMEACIDEGAKRLSATNLFSTRDGDGQVVALLDSGVDDSHPDLCTARIVHKKDYTGKGSTDQHGHGTHLAGVIASGHSKYKGVAPKSTIWSYRVLDEKGTGSSQKQLAQALQDAVEDAVNEAKNLGQMIVINCSCAIPRRARAWGRDYEYVCNAFDDATTDAVVVVAAGNQGPLPRTITAPGGGASVITVGASVDRPDGPHNFVAHYSSRGPAIHRRSKPDIVAPGGLKNLRGDCHEKVSMISSRINGDWAKDKSNEKPWFVDNDHYGASGTSQATAVVSGVCALLLDELAHRKRQVRHSQVAQALKDTALTLGYLDSEQGHGLVQADAAMNWF